MDDTQSSDVIESLDIDAIKDMIPHRPPFLLIDEVVNLIPDVEAVGIKNVRADEPYFEGHFPGHPIMPGVLIVEAMAQTSAVLVVRTMGKQPGSVVYFMSVDQARFRKPVFPGNQLHLHVVKQRQRGPVWKFQGEARVGEDVVAEATFTAMIVDPK
ncbi:MAG TPA: 3-hydroxyacyl-ACP dehydratase FabZ [Rhodospirillales bacterium]|jgi:3-hydroxyacyl-[acyl-carrier-protein] dehydratase|nr:3-hydroxyacyl-ACP dehydratase FabZ [Rhodospirillales bacterium]